MVNLNDLGIQMHLTMHPPCLNPPLFSPRLTRLTGVVKYDNMDRWMRISETMNTDGK